MKSSAIEAIALSDAPTRTERILSDRKAQVLRATTNQSVEEIPCPGQCGGVALLAESPVSVTRDGVTRTIRVAQCQDQCRMESRIGRTGKTRLVPARFDIPWANETTSVKPVSNQATPEENGLSSRLARALRSSGLTQVEAAERIGCSQSGVSKMLRGTTMAPATQQAALKWITCVESGAKAVETGASTTACDHGRDSPQVSRLANGRPHHLKAPDKPVEDIDLGEGIDQEKKPSVPNPTLLPEQRRGLSQDPPTPQNLVAETPRSQESDQASAQEVSESLRSLADSESFFPSLLSPAHYLRVPNPYEAVLRSLLEPAAQQHLEQIAGPAAAGIIVRVSLEWQGNPSADPL